MDHIEYLFAGFAVFWAALFVYLLMLQTRIRSLLREITRLEERLAESEGARTPAAPPVESPPSVESMTPADRRP